MIFLDWLVQKDGNWKPVELKPKFRLQKIRVTVDFLVNELGRDSN